MAGTLYRQSVLRDFNPALGEFENFKYGVNTITGWRIDQEDRYICLPAPNFVKNYSFFGVYDGHGGFEVAEYLKRKLHEHIRSELTVSDDVERGLISGFMECDEACRLIDTDELEILRKNHIKSFENIVPRSQTEEREFRLEVINDIVKEILEIQTRTHQEDAAVASSVNESEDAETLEEDQNVAGCSSNPRRSPRKKLKSTEGVKSTVEVVDKKTGDVNAPVVGLSCGSTATVVVFTDDKIYVANVGDSRCIVSVNKTIKVLTQDHRPYHKEELRRIKETGHKLIKQRIDGGLNMSRAFGDYGLKNQRHLAREKQAVIADPHIISIPNSEDVDFIIIASDGIWNNMRAEELVYRLNHDKMPLPDACRNIINSILCKNKVQQIMDNMTIIVIKKFKKTKNGAQEKKAMKNIKKKDAEEITKSSKRRK